MYELMTKHSGAITGQSTQGSGPRRSGFQLVQQGQCQPVNDQDEELIPGTDGRVFDIVCYNCNKKGHYTLCCPELLTRVGASNLIVGNVLTQVHQQGLIPPDWILLDTCSTDNVVNNVDMVNNLRPCSEEDALKIYTNGGALDYDQAGEFAYLPIKTYYNPESIANVLSLKAVSEMKGYQVTMDTQNDPSIKLHHGDTTLCFPHSSNGLYYCTEEDMTNFKSNIRTNPNSTASGKQSDKHVSFLQAHSKKDTERSIQVRKR